MIRRLIRTIGTGLLGILGFSSCDIISPKAEYGSPNCDFKMDITVVDESGNPLKDIKVTPVLIPGQRQDGSEIREPLRTVSTDASGKASDGINIPYITNTVRVLFEDTDGDLGGGAFRNDSSDFKPVQTKKGDKKWYSGEYTISGTKTLKKQ